MVSDIVDQSPDLLSLDLSFGPGLGLTKLSWLDLCKRIGHNQRTSGLALKYLNLAPLNHDCLSTESGAELTRCPLELAPVTLARLPGMKQAERASLVRNVLVFPSLRTLDLERAIFSVNPEIASLISSKAPLLQTLILPHYTSLQLSIENDDFSVPSIIAQAGSLGNLRLPYLTTLRVCKSVVLFSDISRLAQASPLLKRFHALCCTGQGMGDTGLFHLYEKCPNMTELNCSCDCSQCLVDRADEGKYLRDKLLQFGRRHEPAEFTYFVCEDCMDDYSDAFEIKMGRGITLRQESVYCYTCYARQLLHSVFALAGSCNAAIVIRRVSVAEKDSAPNAWSSPTEVPKRFLGVPAAFGNNALDCMHIDNS
eukprot:CAMPEP_0172599166 /NCGR_PEP_ID=MMETSP1068-20121228/19243_1 /TAXON_ID=35684 /ORGANISM="Pseudopedinella elastica, Strain CCMP716" /LENGTH=367 /DNA_ID=CAMNT_0013399327 /DNA_START=62 /DNA_END=1166 /DNA_ORIENTATION=+